MPIISDARPLLQGRAFFFTIKIKRPDAIIFLFRFYDSVNFHTAGAPPSKNQPSSAA